LLVSALIISCTLRTYANALERGGNGGKGGKVGGGGKGGNGGKGENWAGSASVPLIMRPYSAKSLMKHHVLNTYIIV